MTRNQWRYNDVIEDVMMTSFDFIPGSKRIQSLPEVIIDPIEFISSPSKA